MTSTSAPSELQTKRQMALALFNYSPIKQNKWRAIAGLLPPHLVGECLDIGSDNGVISLLLRERGGNWSSADIEERTVAMITELVGERVFRISPTANELKPASYDLIVVVDLLEHVENDSELARNLLNALRSGGHLIINVPSPQEGVLRFIRARIGQSDQAHGHLRSGYSLAQLNTLIGEGARLNSFLRYSRFFSELCDTVVTLGIDLVKRGGSGEKGRVVQATEVSSQGKLFKVYKLLYPFLSAMVALDSLLVWDSGNMLIADYKKE